MQLDVLAWRVDIDPAACRIITSNDVYITIPNGYDARITVSHNSINLRLRMSSSVSTLCTAVGSSKFIESNNDLTL